MSMRNTAVTDWLYNEFDDDVIAFLSVLRLYFDIVSPYIGSGGKVLFVSLMLRDHDDWQSENETMPTVVVAASKILRGDADIAVAWESRDDGTRQRVWTVPGRHHGPRATEYLKGRS